MAKTGVSGTESIELNHHFLEELRHVPEWDKIKTCIQCGTCTASCPAGWAMDYKPREIIGLFRAGMLDKALLSNTVWMCASCYYCVVRCPSGIKLSDTMYVLRSLAIRHGLFRRGEKVPVLAKAFVRLVDKYGKNAEPELLTRFYLRTNPLGLARLAPLGLNLLRRGRLPLLPKRIRGLNDLNKIMALLEKGESK